MNTTEKIIYYLFNEYFLRNFIEHDYIKFVYEKGLNKFIQLLLNFYDKYNKIPVIDEFQKYIINEPEANEFTVLFIKYQKAYVTEDYQFLIDELRKEYTKHGLGSIITNIDHNRIDLADISYKISKLEQLTDEDIETKKGFIYENTDERFERVKRAVNISSIHTNLEQFDKYTNGLNKKEYYLFFGRSGIGKTRILFTLAYNLSLQGYHGIYFSLEMYKEQMERIYDSRAAGINSELLKHGQVDFSFYRDVLDMIKERKHPYYLIEHTGFTNLAYITAQVREYKNRYPLDYVIIDSLSLMSEKTKLNKHEELGMISKGLKNLAKKENIIIVTAVQANRKMTEADQEGKLVGLEHISQSDLIAHHCDFVAYIKRGKQLEENIIDITIVKNREGRNNVSMKFMVDFPTNTVKDLLTLKIPGQEEEKTEDKSQYKDNRKRGDW